MTLQDILNAIRSPTYRKEEGPTIGWTFHTGTEVLVDMVTQEVRSRAHAGVVEPAQAQVSSETYREEFWGSDRT